VTTVVQKGNSYIVTVRHGKYISVYCNLASVKVSTQQQVKTNQILGSVGVDNILQFQLRNWTSILNPKAWLGR
jgi:septal ring factor EnvC (AmiA/AmiB activator)